MFSAIASARQPQISSLLKQNANLTAEQVWKQHEKNVNAIALSTIGQGNFGLTDPQIATLEYIAGKCPLVEGDAVYQARLVSDEG